MGHLAEFGWLLYGTMQWNSLCPKAFRYVLVRLAFNRLAPYAEILIALDTKTRPGSARHGIFSIFAARVSHYMCGENVTCEVSLGPHRHHKASRQVPLKQGEIY